MKKIISMLLVVTMLISMNSVALAAEFSQAQPKLLEEYAVDTGVYYRYELFRDGEKWVAIVFAPNDGSNITFYAAPRLFPEAEVLENRDYSIYTVSIKPSVNAEKTDYLREGFASLQEATVTNASAFDTIGSASGEMTRDSVQRDLYNDLREIHEDEYERVVYRNLTYPDVNEIAVHEDLIFRHRPKGDKTFAAGTALSLVAIALTNMTGISVALSSLAVVVSVSGEYLAASATIEAYIVEADFGRWTTIDDIDYVYTMTNKIYRYCGLNELNNEVEAYVQNDNPTPIYNPSSSYYNNYSAQAADAYAMYQRMN